MNGAVRIKKYIWYLACAGLLLLTVAGYVKGVFVSLDIDESYAVAQSYRLAMGEHLFKDMWEPHQLSAFFSSVFIYVYVHLFGTTEYLVIYLRVVGMVMHVLLGIWMYRECKGDSGQQLSMLLLFLHLNFFPKWVQMPEFEVMHYWFFLSLFLLLYRYFRKQRGKWWMPAGAGICLVGCMMSYPTMILMYPIYIIGLCILEKQYYGAKGRYAFRSSLWFTLGAGGSGVAFLAYLISYQTPAELLHYISYIFMDESHTNYTTAEKWGMYGTQAAELAEQYFGAMKSAVFAVLIIWGAVILYGLVKKKGTKAYVNSKTAEYAALCVLVLTALILQKDYVMGCLLEDKNQFYLQVRYLAMLMPGIYLGVCYHRKMSLFFWVGILPSIAGLFAALMITNMNVDVTCSRVVVGIWASILMLALYIREEVKGTVGICGRLLLQGMCFGLLCCFFISRIVLIRVTGCLPVTIKAPLEKMEYGPEKGIYIMESQARIWNHNYSMLKDVVQQDDRLLYIGAENMIYPAMECVIATPSTQGTTIFNEVFMHYYEEHPQKLPGIVVIDKTFGTNPVYALYSDTRLILEWLAEKYPDAVVQETDYMTIMHLE